MPGGPAEARGLALVLAPGRLAGMKTGGAAAAGGATFVGGTAPDIGGGGAEGRGGVVPGDGALPLRPVGGVGSAAILVRRRRWRRGCLWRPWGRRARRVGLGAARAHPGGLHPNGARR